MHWQRLVPIIKAVVSQPAAEPQQVSCDPPEKYAYGLVAHVIGCKRALQLAGLRGLVCLSEGPALECEDAWQQQ